MRMPALAALAILALFFGCVSVTEPAACAGLNGAARDGCLYKEAVLSQEPYNCYYIGDIAQRTGCMKDATDQKARQNFTHAQPAPVPSQPVPEVTQPEAPPAENTTTVEEAACASYNGSAADSCYRDLAFQKRDITYCKNVTGSDMRSSCISTVAFAVKNPAICSTFVDERDASLCNFYSKGSAESG